MADYKSDQMTNVDAIPQVKVQANEKGKVHTMYFSYTVPASAGFPKTVELIRMPEGARPFFGRVTWEAMGSNATLTLGDGTTAAKYLGSTDVSSAGQSLFVNTIALGFGDVLAAQTSLVATMGGAEWTAGQKIRGHVNYLID